MTKWYEESPGVSSSSRLLAMILVCAGVLQILTGCAALYFKGDTLGASAAWTAGIGTATTGLGMKNAAKRIEEQSAISNSQSAISGGTTE